MHTSLRQITGALARLVAIAAAFCLVLPDLSLSDEKDNTLSFQVQSSLKTKIKLLKADIQKSKTILEAIRSSNLAHEKISQQQIVALDKKWTESKGMDEFVKSYITAPCSQSLLDIQNNREGFSEIFLTDNKGLNVCQTNKTSDLYQADEEWWMKAHNDSLGQEPFGEIEYDESAHAEVIPVYFSINEETTGGILGVCKAAIDITSLKEDL